MAYYLSPRFLDKLAVHITKNYLQLPQVKIPVILGVHGRKGEGKNLPVRAGLRSHGYRGRPHLRRRARKPRRGRPGRLIRLRYREAAELVRVRGKMAVLMINDIDAGRAASMP
jgi:hypothetical protein